MTMIVTATERYAFGATDPRAVLATNVDSYPPGDCLFTTEAEARGYDMELWRETAPRGVYYCPRMRFR